MIFLTMTALAAAGAAGAWLLSRRDRAQLRQLRQDLAGDEPPALVFPVLFPSADAAARCERAVSRMGYALRVDADAEEIPGAGRWADVEARLPLTWPALRVARFKVQWAVRPQHGTVFDVEWRDGPSRAMPNGGSNGNGAAGKGANGAGPAHGGDSHAVRADPHPTNEGHAA